MVSRVYDREGGRVPTVALKVDVREGNLREGNLHEGNLREGMFVRGTFVRATFVRECSRGATFRATVSTYNSV